MKLLIVRHGITDWNSDGRFQGQQDVILNAVGLEQAHRLALRLANQTISSVFASDLVRARQTASEIATLQTVPVTADPRLREICFGRWEGRYFDEIAQNDAETMRLWRAHDDPSFCVLGGETITQVASRVQAFVNDLNNIPDGHTTLVVSHGGTASVLLCLLLGMPPIRYWQFHLSQTGLSEVSLKPGKVRLNYFNDTCHLSEKTEDRELKTGQENEAL